MKKGSRRIIFDGKSFVNLVDFSSYYKLNYQKTRKRRANGWSFEQLIGREPSPKRKTDIKRKNVLLQEKEINLRKCSVCLLEKKLTYFPKHNTSKNGRSGVCKMCKTESSRKRRYGVCNKEYKKMLEQQCGQCAICGTNKPKTRGKTSFCVDHCHETGLVRGLLCSECNTGLGKFKDKIEFLEKAIEYLKK